MIEDNMFVQLKWSPGVLLGKTCWHELKEGDGVKVFCVQPLPQPVKCYVSDGVRTIQILMDEPAPIPGYIFVPENVLERWIGL